MNDSPVGYLSISSILPVTRTCLSLYFIVVESSLAAYSLCNAFAETATTSPAKMLLFYCLHPVANTLHPALHEP